jgi:hypothetical protein
MLCLAFRWDVFTSRIDHLPGSRNYARVAMNGPDERWLCSEPEAKAAGWRPSGR